MVEYTLCSYYLLPEYIKMDSALTIITVPPVPIPCITVCYRDLPCIFPCIAVHSRVIAVKYRASTVQVLYLE
jgi:hypothetical protein